ncbi:MULTISPECIES: methyltransferase, FxLD system [Frankia]|uniref:Protein-L-isoaspartate O-methyltransferase n=1 Tax=Frankia alni (strain DSM 45986 / CECT 9034 / ACN14a) TaxID=326424 RepID=Q0RMA8_FRAAA|nr:MULTISPECIES: methyltransferase, FxLD system [Frankia]CAJ61344.1 Protein-L-isoaspartate O-methyltransferase 2 (Protein-beta-aspartate methyltransferase 2) (PIMT 2) (Protein L-isoaspartyl methyltransferase 2) (L-isoaspartyl protein carboxyl methyltransferase 2) (partial match) [Frankia alni ACN14a]
MPATVSDASVSSDPARDLRAKLADRLCQDTVKTPEVETAIRDVPRHLFLPGVPLEQAYADDPVYTKHDSGVSISAASQPRIVAMMLEQLHLESGHRVLEVGAGTGYNAALMAAIVGTSGHITAVDIDEDLVESARTHLAAAGVTNVDVVLGDGAFGHPDAAPYDRVIATVGAVETPTAWLDQLAPAGRLVVPLRLAGAASRSIIFERDQDGWISRGSEMCTFMPLRGFGDDARGTVDLTGTGEVTLQTHRDNSHATNQETLTGVLDTPRYEAWTGVVFGPGESFEWLYLWLACGLANPLMRMNVDTAAKKRGLVSPMFSTVAMSTSAADGSLAYLTLRPAPPAADGSRQYEVGVLGHGPTGQQLATDVGQQITLWDQGFRHRHVTFALPDTPPTANTDGGRFVLHRPHRPITVTWE